MNQSLQTIRPDEYSVIREQASALVKTGFLPNAIKTPEQALAIILTGRELGIPAMAALNSINVIQGKPTVSPQLMIALINRSGSLDDIRFDVQADRVSVTMKRKGRTPHTETFGVEQAKALGLMTKSNYNQQAVTMFKWRAVAACARVVFPDVILGLYTHEEINPNLTVNEDGEIIGEAMPEPVTVPVVVDEISDSRKENIAAIGNMMREWNTKGYEPKWDRENIGLFLAEHFKAEAITDLSDEDLTEVFVFLENQLQYQDEKAQEVAF